MVSEDASYHCFRNGARPELFVESSDIRRYVVIDGIRVGHGQGESKKEAEQCAAHSVSCAMSDEACGDILDKIDRLYRPKGTGVS